MSILSDLLEAAMEAVAKFSRKRPPEQPKPFGRNHLRSFSIGREGSCVYCGKPNANEAEACPGP